LIWKYLNTLKNLYPDIPDIQVLEGYKVPAAWLIEHIAQMKGVRVGDVGTWPAQPLVIVNYGSASADDIDHFARSIQNRVNEKTGIVLEQEVNRVG
jgi:UDP-N-acetylmuramate dehydrogenase